MLTRTLRSPHHATTHIYTIHRDQTSPDKTLGDRIKKALDAGKDVTIVVTKAMDSEVVTDFKEADAA